MNRSDLVRRLAEAQLMDEQLQERVEAEKARLRRRRRLGRFIKRLFTFWRYL